MRTPTTFRVDYQHKDLAETQSDVTAAALRHVTKQVVEQTVLANLANVLDGCDLCGDEDRGGGGGGVDAADGGGADDAAAAVAAAASLASLHREEAATLRAEPVRRTTVHA